MTNAELLLFQPPHNDLLTRNAAFLCELVGSLLVVMAYHDFGEHLVQMEVGEAGELLTLGLVL